MYCSPYVNTGLHECLPPGRLFAGTVSEEVWTITVASAILVTYASFVKNKFFLLPQGSIFFSRLGLLLATTSLRNSCTHQALFANYIV